MLTRSTVVVIGAGASFELGLPLGVDLKDQIASLLNITFPDGHYQKTGDDQITHALRNIAQERGDRGINTLLAKCWLIRDAMPASISIDNLLDAHRNDPDIAVIGKLAIARAILQAEKKSKLFNSRNPSRGFSFQDVAGTWLIPLFQILTEGVSKEEAREIFRNVTFIVFNYDRCLEYFLPKALEVYYGFNSQDAMLIADTAQIIHPYGRVGELGEEHSLKTVEFGADYYDLINVARGIRTFSEGLLHESHGARIRKSISSSEQIIFLGFAYHPLNMEILSNSNPCFARKIFGTTVGLSDAAVRTIESDICAAINKEYTPDVYNPRDEYLDEINLESKLCCDFLGAHFRGIGQSFNELSAHAQRTESSRAKTRSAL